MCSALRGANIQEAGSRTEGRDVKAALGGATRARCFPNTARQGIEDELRGSGPFAAQNGPPDRCTKRPRTVGYGVQGLVANRHHTVFISNRPLFVL